MSNLSRSAKWGMLSEACILLTAGMLLDVKFPVIAIGLVLLGPVIAIGLILLGLLLFILAAQLFLVIKMAMNLALRDKSQSDDQKAEPPIIAEFLVGLCVNRRHRNSVLHNLEEVFDQDLAAGMSVRRARSRYWSATLNSIGPRLWALAKRIGIIGVIADYARRLFH